MEQITTSSCKFLMQKANAENESQPVPQDDLQHRPTIVNDYIKNCFEILNTGSQ